MELGISYNCAFDRIIPFYETYYLFSASVVRYEISRCSVLFLLAIFEGITLNTPVLIPSAIFVNKVSWAAMVLAAGGLAYVNDSYSELPLLNSVFSWTMWYGMSRLFLLWSFKISTSL